MNNTKFLFIHNGSIPFGLLNIKAYMQKHNDYNIHIFNYNSNPIALNRILQQFNPDIIGFSAMTLQFKNICNALNAIKKIAPTIPTVIGGIHVTALPQDGNNANFDYIVCGEGERTFTSNQINLQSIPIKDLDEIPFYVDDYLPYIHHYNSSKGFLILTARGCPFSCNFCLSKEQRTPGMRYHSISYIIDMLQSLNQKYNLSSFFIGDDIFVIKPKRVIEFCDAVQPLKFQFHCFSHAGHGSYELYKYMYKAGFRRISLGVEHGNDKILKVAHKHATLASIENTCSIIHKAGLKLNLL